MRRAAILLGLLVTLLLPATLAPAPLAGAVRPGPGWGWPLTPVPNPLAKRFDAPNGPYGAGHRGVDLASTVGAAVVATGAGVVAFAGPVAGRPVVSVDHGDGLRTTYEPVTTFLTRGDRVLLGQVIGTVAAGPGHCLPGTCLHWGLRRGTSYIDPLTLVGGAGTVRLLPLWTDGPPLLGRLPAPVAPVFPAEPAGPADRGPLLARG